jgi:hypothetical protein
MLTVTFGMGSANLGIEDSVKIKGVQLIKISIENVFLPKNNHLPGTYMNVF